MTYIGPTMGHLDTSHTDRTGVRHVCPECGGKTTTDLDGTVFVEICWACGGVGNLTDAQLDWYLKEHNRRVAEQSARASAVLSNFVSNRQGQRYE